MVVFGWDGVAFGFFVLLLVVDAKRRKSVCMKSYQTGSSKDKFLVWRNGKIHAILPQL
ncbi:MAG: hypothetical protein IJR46_04945 [Neisseriaceae bacterium]|nr:hypothetical protein [Neisseriaceae bacterium]